jgi:hypothetical protein
VSAGRDVASDSGEEATPIAVQTRFERFPASVKGAFVMRGADGNPHAVRIQTARVARIPGGPGKEFPAEDRMLDVAPTRELFVPFEAPVTDLPAGWYVIESTIQIDGGRSLVFTSRPFVMSWPRNDVRRGTVSVGAWVTAGKRQIHIDRAELSGDSAAVVWWPDEARKTDLPLPVAAPGEALLIADGRPLDVLPAHVATRGRAGDPRARGEYRTISYPVPRGTRSLAVMIRIGEGRSEPLAVQLP